LLALAEQMRNSSYGQYLFSIADEKMMDSDI